MRSHSISFKHAFDGLVWAFGSQPNFRVHTVISTLVILAGFYFNITNIHWLVLIFTITLGIVIELINTSIESVTDLITTEHRQYAKIAKDTAAAAMLVYAFGSALIGLSIFLPYLNF